MTETTTEKTQLFEQDHVLYGILASFCRMHHIYGQIYDCDGRLCQNFFTDEEVEDYFKRNILQDQVMLLLSAFRDYDAENIIAGHTNAPHLMLRGVALRGEYGELRNIVVLYGVDEEEIEEGERLAARRRAHRRAPRAELRGEGSERARIEPNRLGR